MSAIVNIDIKISEHTKFKRNYIEFYLATVNLAQFVYSSVILSYKLQ